MEVKDGERLPLGVKDMGSCEIFPQTISHNPNGRYENVFTDINEVFKVYPSKSLMYFKNKQVHLSVPLHLVQITAFWVSH